MLLLLWKWPVIMQQNNKYPHVNRIVQSKARISNNQTINNCFFHVTARWWNIKYKQTLTVLSLLNISSPQRPSWSGCGHMGRLGQTNIFFPTSRSFLLSPIIFFLPKSWSRQFPPPFLFSLRLWVMCMSLNNNTTRVTSRTGNANPSDAHEFIPRFLCGFLVDQSLVFCVLFCRSLLVLWSFFFRPLCCLSCFHLLILITPLVSSNFSVVNF